MANPDVVVSLSSGNAWKVLAANPTTIISDKSQWLSNESARLDWTNKAWLRAEGKTAAEWKNRGCRGLLGDGWHVPSRVDLDLDRDYLKGSSIGSHLKSQRFWLSDIEGSRRAGKVKPSAFFTGKLSDATPGKISSHTGEALPTVCVCGPRTSENDSRRSKSHCLGFHDENLADSEPREVELVTNSAGTPTKAGVATALSVCMGRGKRVPSTEELARIHLRIKDRLGNSGCVWSSTPSGQERLPREMWSLDGIEGGHGVGIATENLPCFIACVS